MRIGARCALLGGRGERGLPLPSLPLRQLVGGQGSSEGKAAAGKWPTIFPFDVVQWRLSRRRRPWQLSRKTSFRPSSRRPRRLPGISDDDSKQKPPSSSATVPPAKPRSSSAGGEPRSIPDL